MDSTELRTLDIKQMSTILGRTVETLYMDRKRRPNSIPPALKIPGTKKLIWIASDVEEWLRKWTEKSIGRPRNSH